MDISEFTAPDSTQINADDLIAGPITVTVEGVTKGTREQPVNIALVERPGRAYRPSKSMRRVIVAAWGAESDVYAGRRMTLYRDPDVRFGKEAVGGVKISHLSHIGSPLRIPLTVSRGKRAIHEVQPLSAEAKTADEMPRFGTASEARAYYSRRRAAGASDAELAEIRSVGSALAASGE